MCACITIKINFLELAHKRMPFQNSFGRKKKDVLEATRASWVIQDRDSLSPKSPIHSIFLPLSKLATFSLCRLIFSTSAT